LYPASTVAGEAGPAADAGRAGTRDNVNVAACAETREPLAGLVSLSPSASAGRLCASCIPYPPIPRSVRLGWRVRFPASPRVRVRTRTPWGFRLQRWPGRGACCAVGWVRCGLWSSNQEELENAS